jgi:hypothetical protein
VQAVAAFKLSFRRLAAQSFRPCERADVMNQGGS